MPFLVVSLTLQSSCVLRAGDLTFLGDFEHESLDFNLDGRSGANSNTVTGSPWHLVSHFDYLPNLVDRIPGGVPVREGKFAGRVHLVRARVKPGAPKFNYRSELAPRLTPPAITHPAQYKVQDQVQFGQDHWYALSIFFPNDFLDDKVSASIVQWRGIEDKDSNGKYIDTNGRNPMMSIRVKNGRISVGGLWDTRPISPSKAEADADPSIDRYEGHRTYWTGALADRRGRWTDFAFRIKWSWEADGQFDMWMDGKQVASVSGPNAFNDTSPPHFRIGIYKSGWKFSEDRVNERTIYYDEVRLAGADASLEEVSPPSGAGNHPSGPR